MALYNIKNYHTYQIKNYPFLALYSFKILKMLIRINTNESVKKQIDYKRSTKNLPLPEKFLTNG